MAPATGQFDIYQSAVGVTAVTSPVQRQILEALAESDLQLPEIVELTGKAKSTLSSIHMKELLNRELVQELPHPTDSRRKIYRLIGRPMRSDRNGDAAPGSVTPRAATTPPTPAIPTGAPGLPLAGVFQVLAAAPESAQHAVDVQAEELGRRYAKRIPAKDVTAFASGLTRFVEEERLAHHLQLDFESLNFRCRPGAGVADIPPIRLGHLLAAFAQGAAAANGLDGVAFNVEGEGDAFRLTPVRS